MPSHMSAPADDEIPSRKKDVVVQFAWQKYSAGGWPHVAAAAQSYDAELRFANLAGIWRSGSESGGIFSAGLSPRLSKQ